MIKAAHQAQETARHRYGRRPAVVISADHGFTTPAPGAVLETAPGGGIAESDRCVRFVRDHAAEPGEGWIVLESPADYGLVHRYALAYGNRFLGNVSPTRATHGGANPEEVFVPYIEFDGVLGTLEPPAVRISGRLRSDAEEQPCALAVRNPNLRQLVDVSIESRYFAAPVRIGMVGSMEEVVAAAVLQGGPNPAGVLPVPVTVRFRAATTPEEALRIEVLATVARALQSEAPTKDALEEMFRD